MASIERRQRRQPVSTVEREKTILDVAAGLFLHHGYEKVSIDAIVNVAGGSRRDLYASFGDKLSLFNRVVVDLCQSRIRPMQELVDQGSLQSSLIALGESVLGTLLAPETLALHRLIVSEAVRLPEAARLFLQQGPNIAYAATADLFRRSETESALPVGADDLARIFIDAVLGELQLRALMGEAIGPEDISRKVRVVVDSLVPTPR